MDRSACGVGIRRRCSVDNLLKSVESRYNQAKTLEVLFNESYTPQGKPPRTESGKLMLRKPGRMRWDYTQPKGKLFVSDGKYLWLYTPADNRAERMKLQESEDMRAPLAFLLGKLNFRKGVPQFAGGAGGRRHAHHGRTQNGQPALYRRWSSWCAPDARIREVKVTGFDKSMLDFTFDQEKMDPPLDAELFQFKRAGGAEVVEGDQ